MTSLRHAILFAACAIATACGKDPVASVEPPRPVRTQVVQPVEVITVTDEAGAPRDGLVIYSVGNTISHQRTFPRAAGLAPRVTLARCPELGRTWVLGARLTPTWVDASAAAGPPSSLCAARPRTLPVVR